MKALRKFRRAAALAAALALLLALAACGQKEPVDYGIEVEGPSRTSAPAPSSTGESAPTPTPAPEEAVVWQTEPRTDLEITRSLADYDPPAMGGLTGQARLAFFVQDGGTGVIDLSGRIVVPASENVHWCPNCGITNADESRIFDAAGNVIGSGGHGGAQDPYVYDELSGQAYAQDYGYYTPWADRYEQSAGYALVPVVQLARLEPGTFSFAYLLEGITEVPVEVTETHSYLLLNKATGQPVNSQRYTGYTVKANLFTVQQNGLWGCIDGEGHQLLPCEYLEVCPYNEGVAAVHTGDGWGFVDMAGHPFTRMDLQGAASAAEGSAWVKTEEGWGVIELAKNSVG